MRAKSTNSPLASHIDKELGQQTNPNPQADTLERLRRDQPQLADRQPAGPGKKETYPHQPQPEELFRRSEQQVEIKLKFL